MLALHGIVEFGVSRAVDVAAKERGDLLGGGLAKFAVTVEAGWFRLDFDLGHEHTISLARDGRKVASNENTPPRLASSLS